MRNVTAMPAGLPACKQYINFRLVPKANGKTDKLPLDLAGNVIDPHNSTFWNDPEACWASPFNTHGVGWLVTPGWIVIDLDNCLVNGAWSPLALELCAAFSGAYVDVTPSGTGLRIICRGVLPEGHRCRFDGGEVYSLRRFVTITGSGARGDANWDAQYLMPWLVERLHLHPEPVADLEDVEPDAGRLAEHLTDEQLIAKMIEQKPSSAAQMMGATMAQKWHVDAEACARLFPASDRSDGLLFDHSSLDLSVTSDLAYWTGHDAPRMERLFMQWPGYRDWKYATRSRYHMTRVLRRGLTNKSFYGARQVATVGTAAATVPGEPEAQPGQFMAYLPDHTYYHRPTGAFWPAASVDDLIPPVRIGTSAFHDAEIKTIKATKWLARNHPLHARTWWPGKPEIIDGFLFRDGEMFEAPGNRTLNMYQPPSAPMGNGHEVEPWLAHIRMLYPEHWATLVRWMAFVAQNPGVKVNWAPVLAGGQRIGKDTLLAPLIRAVGTHNWKDVTPDLVLKSDFNEYLRCRVLLISEMKDTGQHGNAFQLYNRLKPIIAAPPGTHRINPKHDRPFIIPNLSATVMTTNYQTGGMYLPADDGRHFVVWSEAVRATIGDEYFIRLWLWLNGGGLENCAAYLMGADVRDFNPMAVPEKTQAFWDMVNAGQSSESIDLGDVAAAFNGEPFSIKQLAMTALMNFNDKALSEWLSDNRNSRKIGHALADAGIIQHRNPGDKQRGRWYSDAEKRPICLYRLSR